MLGSPVFWRYMLFQIPGLCFAGIGLVLLVRWTSLTPTAAWLLLGAWLLKDLVLFPRLRIAYEPRPSPSGLDALLGAAGRAMTPLTPEAPGRVRVGPEQWKAELTAGSARLDSGAAVRVVEVHGLTLRVEPAEE